MEVETAEAQSLCSICDEALGDPTTLTVMKKKKGLASFIDKSKSREDGKWTSWVEKESITIHETCRRRYSVLQREFAKKRPLEADVSEDEPPTSITCLRSLPPTSEEQFSSSISRPVNSVPITEVPLPSNDQTSNIVVDCLNLCFLCATEVKEDGKEFKHVHKKRLFDMFLDEARRKNDESGLSVLHHLEGTGFGNQKLWYHTTCRKTFFADTSDSWDRESSSTLLTNELPFDVNPEVLFDFSTLCFLCGEKLKGDEHRNVQQRFLFDRFIDQAVQRGDEHGCLILNRLNRIGFGAQKLYYHTDCRSTFFNDPIDPMKLEKRILLDKVCSFIESTKGIQVDYRALHELVKDTAFANNKTLFSKLQEKYGEDIRIVQHRGRYPVIYYKMLDLAKMCDDDGNLNDHAKSQVLFTASQILREEVLSHEYSSGARDSSRTFVDNAVADIPPRLKHFLSNLLKGVQDRRGGPEEENVRCYAIAHAVISFLRPQLFISNLQMALGSFVYRKTRSKIIISALSKLGVCPSYYNIQKHEASSVTSDPPTAEVSDNEFLQFVFSHNRSRMVEAMSDRDENEQLLCNEVNEGFDQQLGFEQYKVEPSVD